MTVAELLDARDVDLGASDWVTVDQDQINLFADATGDHQWIHVDQDRAAQGPFGGTIAHGYLTIALLPRLVGGLTALSDVKMGINYGIDKLRLTAPVPSGSRIRARGRLVDAERKGDGVLYRVEATVELEGSERPALIGTVLYLVYS
jgi:acyl dehydratase